MTHEQLNTLQELMHDDTFNGKDLLGWLIWYNTEKPKYKVGDYVKFTDYSFRIYGKRIVNFNAKVVKVKAFLKEKIWRYELEFTCKFDGRDDYTTKGYSAEGDMKPSDTDINYLGETESKHSEEITPIGLGI